MRIFRLEEALDGSKETLAPKIKENLKILKDMKADLIEMLQN